MNVNLSEQFLNVQISTLNARGLRLLASHVLVFLFTTLILYVCDISMYACTYKHMPVSRKKSETSQD